ELDNPVFMPSRTGAEAAAKELGPTYNADIQIDWQTPVEEDGQIQAQNIQHAIASHSDAILISCSDAAKVTGAINDAVKAGIPVMTFDSDAPKSQRFAFYGTDDIDCGARVMDELAKQNGEKGNVAILAGNQNAPNLQKRVQGALDAAKKYPNITIVGVFNHKESPQEASQKVMEAMRANPQIDGWAMIGGWPLFATSLLTDLPKDKVKVVSVDALPEELAYVDAGIAPILLAQPIFEWGHQSVKIIADHVLGKKEVPVINKMELVPVTKETLGEWAKKLAVVGDEGRPQVSGHEVGEWVNRLIGEWEGQAASLCAQFIPVTSSAICPLRPFPQSAH
ncbi:MAG: substrate-binding domain-containing protein, partial [Fimbriimonadales bacterium]